MYKNRYTIIAYGENQVGLLNRISGIFTRRHINIESLTVSSSEIEKVHKMTILVFDEYERVRKVTQQIERQIEVIRAYFYTDEETIFQEIALYKVSKSKGSEQLFLDLVKRFNAKIITGNDEYVVIEKTGHYKDTKDLFDALKANDFIILQFNRSGRVSVSKAIMPISSIIQKFEQNQ